MNEQLVRQLVEAADRINKPDFIGEDPVQFPRRFSSLQDIEISGLLVAAISWGRRAMIRRDAERLLELMNYQPYHFMMEQEYRTLDPNLNIHRTFFARDLQWYLQGLREIYKRSGSLDAFASSIAVGEEAAPAWQLAAEMQKIITNANAGTVCPQCLPTNLRTTALKRLNMALRWFVRDDGIVDIGVWKSIPKSKLFIPLDVHSGNTARRLGILDRKANDRKSVELLTSEMREIRPDDPASLDFALFGLGVTGELKDNVVK